MRSWPGRLGQRHLPGREWHLVPSGAWGSSVMCLLSPQASPSLLAPDRLWVGSGGEGASRA